jgi:hypothetical protein
MLSLPAFRKFRFLSVFCRIVATAWQMRNEVMASFAVSSLILKPHVVADLGL